MRICLFITVITLLLVTAVRAQHQVHEKLYSHFLKDTLHYTVILPENWDNRKQLPVLYAVKYGMMDGLYVAAQIRYLRSARYAIPDMIVVEVNADMDRMGFIYRTGMLTATGLEFLQCLRAELMGDVTRKFNTSSFAAYMGHSYAASYANYLVQHAPGLFDAYILLAPEAVGLDFSKSLEGQTLACTFRLSAKAAAFYNEQISFYYAAVGQYDLQRRHSYAQNVVSELSRLDTLHFMGKYDSIPRADHTNILTMAIESALTFIGQRYNPAAEADPSASAWNAFKKLAADVRSVYGIDVEHSQNWYARFARWAIEQKDTASLVNILDYFDEGSLRAFDLRTFGDYCLQAGMRPRAARYFQSAINRLRDQPAVEGWEYFVLADCYWRMASAVKKDQPVHSLAYLRNAVQLAEKPNQEGAKNIDMYFLAGRYLVERGYAVDEGIRYLLRYLELRQRAIEDIHWSYEKIYACLGKGYYLKKDKKNARLYLLKAAALEADNQEVEAILKKLRES